MKKIRAELLAASLMGGVAPTRRVPSHMDARVTQGRRLDNLHASADTSIADRPHRNEREIARNRRRTEQAAAKAARQAVR